ncbi:MAG TPA: hypothetical protein VIH67_12300 [Candidatus Acidoferrum sp.]
MSNVATAVSYAAVIDIGGTPIRILTDNDSFHRLVQNRYAGFLNSGSQAAAIELTIDLAPPGEISKREDVRVVRESACWSAERLDFRLDWDSKTGCGKVRQSANPYSLDSILRILHTLVLAHQGGFLLHASSAVRNGRAFLFFGPSGAGKTTIARLAPSDAALLTDEISYVRKEQSGYFAHGTPFTGELGRSGENISAPIAGLYYLVQAPRNNLTALKPAEAVRVLLESVLFFAEDPELVALVFQSACDLVSQLPVYKLEFERDPSVWDMLA